MAAEVAALVSAGRPSLEALLDDAAEMICRGMADACVLGVLFDHDSKIHPLGLYHRDERLRRMLNAASELAWEPLGGVSQQVLASGVPALLDSVDLRSLARHPRLAALADEATVHTALVAPMHAVGQPVGVMAMGRTSPSAPYSEDDFKVAQLVADRLGLAISVLHLQEALDTGSGQADVAGPADRRLAALTEREREVFRLIGDGLTSREIGEQLFLSVRTVEWHRARLMAKLGVSTRSELIALGRSIRP